MRHLLCVSPPMPGAIEQGMTTWATMTNLRTFALAAAAIAVVSTSLPPAVYATPARDTDGKVIWQMSDDGKDYIFREITIAPGGSTGWHSHDGELLGVVKEGADALPVRLHDRRDVHDRPEHRGEGRSWLRAHRPQSRP